MKVHFYLRYATQFGESFSLCFTGGARLPLEYLSDELWHAILFLAPEEFTNGLAYTYEFHSADGLQKPEADPGRRLHLSEFEGDVAVCDYFNPMGLLENVFATQPFRPREVSLSESKSAKPSSATHVFKVKASMLEADEVVCLLGHGKALRNWDTAAPILLKNTGAWWETRLDLSEEEFPLGYKYGVWNTRTNKFLGFEEGGNRAIHAIQQSTVKGQQSTVNSQRSTVNSQRSTVKGQQSTVNSQQSSTTTSRVFR
ncbi:MAG: carbohydrate-binding module family 20 domain-containing protein [Saprospiraceae bacterium]